MPSPAPARIAAVAAIVLAPLIPGVLSAGSTAAVAGIPVETLAVVLLLVVLPWRGARVAVAVLFGFAVVLATVLAGLDLAFRATIDRPFSATDALPQLDAASGVVRDAVGPIGLVAALVLVVVVLGVAVWALAVAALVSGRAAAGDGGRRALGIAAVAWIAAAAVGAQVVPGVPLAAADTARGITSTAEQAAAGIRDRASFERALRTDAYRGASGDQLLGALAGKDVVIAFVESYGRVAIEDSTFAPGVRNVLTDGAARLAADGYLARSAFLTSPTFGGVSWLAHSTLQSGVWTDSPQKYDDLTASDRFTLSRAFARAGWRTVDVVPSNKADWPVASSFYGYDEVLDSRSLGYRGPAFSYARVPDQFTWQAFHDRELARPHAPVMTEIDLVSSHTPWTPLPHLVPWDALGDGTVFDLQPAQGVQPVVAWQDPKRVQALYGQSVQYSLGATISYLETYPDPDLVLVIVGDHQPAHIVSGQHPGHDVPITIVSQDPAVMAAIDSWRWDAGLLPSRNAPVWRMDAFRDRFLEAFSG